MNTGRASAVADLRHRTKALRRMVWALQPHGSPSVIADLKRLAPEIEQLVAQVTTTLEAVMRATPDRAD